MGQKILLTGSPGCGKTTLVLHLAERLGLKNLAGFITQEIRSGGQRIGFGIQTFSGREGVLSGIDIRSPFRVGRYGVDVAQFERVVLPELAKEPETVDLFIIDEIGRMECFSKAFMNAVRNILDSPAPLLATIAQKGPGFIEEVKHRKEVDLIRVTADNRDSLLPGLLNKLRI